MLVDSCILLQASPKIELFWLSYCADDNIEFRKSEVEPGVSVLSVNGSNWNICHSTESKVQGLSVWYGPFSYQFQVGDR